MDVSAVIKTSVSDGSGVFLHAFSENLEPPLLAGIDDYTVAGLLGAFFGAEQRYTLLESRYPFVRKIPLSIDGDPSNAEQPAMGLVISSFTDPSHSNTVSMACFTEASLRGFLASGFESQFGNGDDESIAPLIKIINTTPMSQLASVLSDALNDMAAGAMQFTLTIHKAPKLTITRLTESDFNTLRNDFFGSVETPFFDAFDLINARIIRQEGYLDAAGYVPAVYTNNGGDGSNDTIVFTSEYAISQSVTSLT